MSITIGQNQYLFALTSLIGSNDVICSKSLPFKGYTVFLGDKCECASVNEGEHLALLLGYVVDAEKKSSDAEDLLCDFIRSIKPDSSNIADCVKYWGGRWILIYTVGEKVSVVTDTCGLKQAFYYTFNNETLTVASQARYIAALYSLSEDKDARQYINNAMQADKEYSWPADATLYERVKRLLPNHIVSDNGSYPIRYTPAGYKTLKQVARMTELLKNQINGLQSCYKSAITLTAGWDSRIVFAAADRKNPNSVAVTLKYNGVSENSLDIAVPVNIAQKEGIEHRIVVCLPTSETFEKRYKAHGENAHTYWSQMAQAVEANGFKDYYWVKGSCNEVLRCSSGVLYNWQVNASDLCKLFQIPYDDFSKRVLTEWIEKARPYCNSNGIRLLDLFYWEHRCGSWLAECLNENDLVGETFTPFNCRAYLELGLTVKEYQRTSPAYRLFDEIIKMCGLNTDIPVNSGRYSSFKSKFKCLLKNRLHLLYGLVLHFTK